MTRLESVLQEISEKKTAFFLGAGAAISNSQAEHQLPDGTGMKLKLFHRKYGTNTLQQGEKAFRKEFKIPKDEWISPEHVWEKCLEEEGSRLTAHISFLYDVFDKDKYIPTTYKFLSRLHLMRLDAVNQIVTTNFDEKLEAAYRLWHQRGIQPEIGIFSAVSDRDYSHITERIKDACIVYKLHGTLSRPFEIKSSRSDITSSLSTEKYEALLRIFQANSLVVILGYACNDYDVFNAFTQIAPLATDTRLIWIKRSPPDRAKDQALLSVLKSFKCEGSVLLCSADEFVRALFERYVSREEINPGDIQGHSLAIMQNVVESSTALVSVTHKSTIPDVLHSAILIPTDVEEGFFKILNSVDVQRLRDIKQLSFAHLRFPSATHTRFAHSLGVAHLVAQALSGPHLKKIAGPSDVRNAMLAALLHDVGHGPLGHVLDKFYDRLGTPNQHERFTRQFIDEGLFDLARYTKRAGIDIGTVNALISFKCDSQEAVSELGTKVYLAWLITDCALDLDRIDFLTRDLIMTRASMAHPLPNPTQLDLGSTLPTFDPAYLRRVVNGFVQLLAATSVSNVDKLPSPEFPQNAQVLYLEEGGEFPAQALIDFYLALYVDMYLNVYYEDHVSCAEAMMAKALNIAYEDGDIDRTTIYKFTDSELYTYLENVENDLVRQIVQYVKHRRLFRPIAQFKLSPTPGPTAREVETRLHLRLGLPLKSIDSMIVVNIPRQKSLQNLYVRKASSIITSPSLEHFSRLLADGIRGKVYVHAGHAIWADPSSIQIVIDALGEIGYEGAAV